MPGTLDGRKIALAEGRQLEDLAQMLEKEGATPIRCPMVSILDAPDPAPVMAWLRDLIDGRFACVIFMTGEALRRLLGFAERAGMRAEVVAAVGRTRTVTRGPKPAKALQEIGLAPTLTAQAPTTEGVITTLRRESLRCQTVGLTLYGEPNPPLVHFLEEAGATVHQVMPYVYAPATDSERVADLIRRLASGDIEAIIFTSSPQVDRLYDVAAQCDLMEALQYGLDRTCVAAVGPVVSDNLRQKGGPVNVCPDQGFVMKNLVQQLKKALHERGL
jgi:uroporphyrinogen-III synthase